MQTKWPLRLTLLGLLMFAAALGTLFAPGSSQAVSSSYCSTITRCMNTSYYAGWYPVIGYGILPLDNHYNYWDSTAWDYTNQWSFPSACTNQAAIDASGAAGIFPLPACVKDPAYADKFISTISSDISGNDVCPEPLAPIGTPPDQLPPCAYAQRQAMGAAMIINTMMKVDPTSFTTSSVNGSIVNGVNSARNLFSTWAGLVRAYDARGLVDWDFKTVEQPNHINSTWTQLKNSQYIVGQDDVFFSNPYIYPVAEIKFSSPGGGAFFEINRRCGNINGLVNPFPDFNVSPLLQSGAGTPPGGSSAVPGGPLQAGNPYTVRAGAWNAGPGPAALQTYTLTIPASVTPTAFNGGSWNPGNRTVTWTGVDIAGYGVGGATFKDLGFTVNPGTPDGALLIFSLVVGPHDTSGANAPPVELAYEVQNPQYPAVHAFNGDIHAGGGCSAAASAVGHGNIIGNINSDSFGEYVVAASGFTSNFASNSGGRTLSSNFYHQVCRPDLLKTAQTARTSSSPTLPLASSGDVSALSAAATVNLGNITGAGKPDVYYFDGPTLNISGIIHSKLTIVTSGNIHITGNVMLDPAPAAARFVPSLGLIAGGDITIDPVVTRVDAYLFANQNIDTCSAHNSSCATPSLVVRGFLMGKDLLLNRLGPNGQSGAQESERIILMPELYLNPPRFFGAADLGPGAPQGAGEMPPLF